MLSEVYAPFEPTDTAAAIRSQIAVMKEAGVHQIELAMTQAALTPNRHIAETVRKAYPGFINMMINVPPMVEGQPTSQHELKLMRQQMRRLHHNADGFVVGMKTANGILNVTEARKLLQAGGGKEMTYRLDDIDPRYYEDAIEKLAGLGYKRVLTSGKKGGRITHDIADLEKVDALATRHGMTILARGGITFNDISDYHLGNRIVNLSGIHARFDDTCTGSKAFDATTFGDAHTILAVRGAVPEVPRPRRGLFGTGLFQRAPRG